MEYHNKHYKQLKTEVQDFSQKWDLNGTEHSFLKYVSRCRFKNKDQDLVKANWFYNGETKNGTITRDAVKIKPRLFYFDLMAYCMDNDFTDWQNEALFSFFKRRFREVDVALEDGKKEFSELREGGEPSCKIEFAD